LLISRIDISTSDNLIIGILFQEFIFLLVTVIIDIKNDISTSKIDINNLFWMAAYGEISLVKMQLQIPAIKLLISKNVIVDIKNWIVDIKNSYPGNE